MLLTNRINKEILKENLRKETFRRRTLSFYKYINIQDPEGLRNTLFREWNSIGCFGRIYIAHEGINAQMSVPDHQLEAFHKSREEFPELSGAQVKYAVDDNGKSFYKLTIKVRARIVADGLEDESYDMSKVGQHLQALDFHKALDEPDTIVVDMRNSYESEVGRFKGAYCPDAGTFREAIHIVADKFRQVKNKKFLLYCTGGIRCEKASAYLIRQGFLNVYQLKGGIIEYAEQIKKHNLSSQFTGKNFVFDERLGESIDGNIISSCNQCGKPCDTHTNCANNDCHLLFIQCDKCRETFKGCCSADCKEINELLPSERIKFRVLRKAKYSKSKIFSKKLKTIRLEVP